MDSANTSRIYVWAIFCLLTLCSHSEGRPTDNGFDFDNLFHRTSETFYNIYDPIANVTKDFVVGNIYDPIANVTKDFVGNIYDPIANVTKDFVVGNIYDPIANATQDFVGNIYDPIANVTKDFVVGNIYDPIANATQDFVGNIYDPIANVTKDFVVGNIYDPIANATQDFVGNIYDPIANVTKDFVGNISKDVQDSFHNINNSLANIPEEKWKNCSIVVGGALAGAGIGIVAVGIGVPLVLCLIGFTCCGIMAGSAAACCQSGIGDVPAGSCFACFQSLGAGGGGYTYLIISLIVGIPLGLYVGGLYTETYFPCFTSS